MKLQALAVLACCSSAEDEAFRLRVVVSCVRNVLVAAGGMLADWSLSDSAVTVGAPTAEPGSCRTTGSTRVQHFL